MRTGFNWSRIRLNGCCEHSNDTWGPQKTENFVSSWTRIRSSWRILLCEVSTKIRPANEISGFHCGADIHDGFLGSAALRTEGVCSSETWVPTYKSTGRHNPEDSCGRLSTHVMIRTKAVSKGNLKRFNTFWTNRTGQTIANIYEMGEMWKQQDLPYFIPKFTRRKITSINQNSQFFRRWKPVF
jgi:hypothetical protein